MINSSGNETGNLHNDPARDGLNRYDPPEPFLSILPFGVQAGPSVCTSELRHLRGFLLKAVFNLPMSAQRRHRDQ